MSRRGQKRTVSPDAVAVVSNKQPRSNVPKISDIHDAVEFAPIDEVVKLIESLSEHLKSLSDNEVDCVEAILLAPRTKIAANGQSFSSSLIHVFADDRYDLNDEYYAKDQKVWLRNMNTEEGRCEEAGLFLDVLLSHGADPHAKASNGQTALHMAMTNGFTNVVQSLLDQVPYTLDHFNQLDEEKDNPFSCALTNAQNHCAALFLERVPPETILYMFDGEGNNTIAQLCQYCSVNYHSSEFDQEELDDPHSTLTMLKKLLNVVKEQEMIDVLLHTNRYDENCLHVAARCGNLYEIAEILQLQFECGMAVANCQLNGMTPLDRIRKTKDLVLNRASAEQFSKQFAIYGLEEPIAEDRSLGNWLKNSIEPAIELLEVSQERKYVTLEEVLSDRPGAKAGNTQNLFPAALRLKDQYFLKERQGTPKVVVPNRHMAGFIKTQIEILLGKSSDELSSMGRNERGVLKCIQPFQIRDPHDPCLRSKSYALSRQYGVTTTKGIKCNTIIGEYAGNVSRNGEDNSDWGALPTFGVGMEALDAVVAKHRPEDSDKVFILDAYKYCNEMALINDATANFLAEDDQFEADHREANVEFVEVLFDGWPRIFVVARDDVAAGEELLVRYGHAYWARLRTHYFKEKWSASRGMAKERMLDMIPEGHFEFTHLAPGQLEALRWNENSGMPPGKIVAPNLYRLGLSSRVSETLLEYCNRTKIAARARRITIGGGTLDVGTEEFATIGGQNWTIQRHSSHDESNLQWIAPADEEAYNDLLEALSIAGFDSVLHDIGSELGFEGLTVYQASFICVSLCSDGRLHFDVSKTGGRAFNIIIPLILAEKCLGPELEVQPANDTSYPPTVGDYRYIPNNAILLGDDVMHATGRVDYTATREFRLAISVYVADIRDDNAVALEDSFTQPYRRTANELKNMTGAHWKKHGGSRLPKPGRGHILR